MKIKRIICMLLAVALTLTGFTSAFANDLSKDKNKDGYVTYLESLEFPDRNTKVSSDVRDSDITFIVNGQVREFKNKPYIKDSEIMAPAKELFESFGVFLGFEEDVYLLPEGTDAYVGEINGVPMAICPDSDTVWYDDIPLELTTPTVAVEGDVYIPMYIVQFIYGIDFKIDGGNVTINIKCSEPERPKIVEPFDEKKFADVESQLVIDLDTVINNLPADSDGLKYNVVYPEDGMFDKVLQMTNVTVPSLFYEHQGIWAGHCDIAKGDILTMEMWVRSDVRDQSTVPITSVIEVGGYPWEALVGTEFQVSGEWTRYVFVGMSAYDCEKNGAGAGRYDLHIKVGYRKNTTYEIGFLKVVNYGKNITPEQTGISKGEPIEVVEPLEYRGHEDDHLWREEALRRIEKYRKAPLKVNVVDEAGNPVKDAGVKVDMTRNEFMISWELQGDSERQPILRRQVEAHEEQGFNAFVPGAGFRQPWTEWVLSSAVKNTDMARETNSPFRGHALIYDLYSAAGHSIYAPSVIHGAYEPLSIGGMSYEDTFRLYMSGMSGRIALFDDYVDEWDAINETKSGHIPIIDNHGYEILQDLFECARLMLKPESRLYYMDSRMDGFSEKDVDSGINVTEDGIRWNNEEADMMTFEGFKMDGMAGQCHIGTDATGMYRPNPVDYYRQMLVYSDGYDTYSVTEYDYTDKTVDTQLDTELHNEAIGLYLRDWFLATFSLPKATCFSIWDSGMDTWHWRSWAPFLDNSYQEKGNNLQMWLDMVKKDFESHVTGTTDENGNYEERVFRGDYDVVVTVGDKTAKTTLKVTEDGENTVTAVVKADGIEMTTSEKVTTVADRTEPMDDDWVYNNYRNMQVEWRKFAESEISSATTEKGEDAAYILGKQNTVPWVSAEDDNYLLFELKENLEKGYVTLKWPSDRKALYTVEGSEDGSTWEKIKTLESTERDIVPFYEKNYKYIKVSNMSSIPMALNSVAVYRARFFAKTE